jgi:hypothetical protein
VEKARKNRPRIFHRVDCWSFGIATALSLAIYCFTLPPHITFDSSGVYATAANYGGIGPNPGFPLWTAYAWLFIHMVPFKTVAVAETD